jgi:hypothetical protein
MTRRHRTASPDVLPTSEASRSLAATLGVFKERGAEAEPIFFGPGEEPAGVMLSYERYLKILDRLDDLSIAFEVRKRDRRDDGTRLSLAELAREHDVDPSDIGLR